MKNFICKRPLVTILAIVGLCIFAWGGYYAVKRIVSHERTQNQAITELKTQVAILSEKVNSNDVSRNFTNAVSQDGFDYLAIGNSITLHPITDYWWGEWGMAASDANHDYFHLITDGIEEKLENEKKVNAFAINYYMWEVTANDRSETWSQLDDCLMPGVDLVTIQLGENAYDLSTLESDMTSMINHIYEKCPGVQVIVIDGFNETDSHEMRKGAAKASGAAFVDLSDIRDVEEYRAGLGTIVEGDDGQDHVIEHEGVARHPGDKGMQVIAERVMESLKGFEQ